MKDQAEADPENHKTFMLPGGRRSDRSVWRGGWCVRTAQTRAPVVVRLPRESAWSEKRAIPEPLSTAAHKVEEEPAGASCEGEREPGPRVRAEGKRGAVCRVGSARQDLMPSKGRKVWTGMSLWMTGQLWSQAAWFSDLRFLSSVGHRIPLELYI